MESRVRAAGVAARVAELRGGGPRAHPVSAEGEDEAAVAAGVPDRARLLLPLDSVRGPDGDVRLLAEGGAQGGERAAAAGSGERVVERGRDGAVAGGGAAEPRGGAGGAADGEGERAGGEQREGEGRVEREEEGGRGQDEEDDEHVWAAECAEQGESESGLVCLFRRLTNR